MFDYTYSLDFVVLFPSFSIPFAIGPTGITCFLSSCENVETATGLDLIFFFQIFTCRAVISPEKNGGREKPRSLVDPWAGVITGEGETDQQRKTSGNTRLHPLLSWDGPP